MSYCECPPGSSDRLDRHNTSICVSYLERTRRRKHRVYHKGYTPQSPISFQFGRKKRKNSVKVEPRRVPVSVYDSNESTGAIRGSVSGNRYSHEVTRIYTLRRRLRVISCLLALLSGLGSVLGYFVGVLKGSDGDYMGDSLEVSAGLVILAVGEMGLLVGYWQSVCSYEDLKNGVMKVDYVHTASLWHSPAFLGPCLLEIAVHMLAPYPGLTFSITMHQGGVDSTYSLNDLLFPVLILRNYHLLRVLYWFSPFSHLRTFMYMRITNVNSGNRFVFRGYLQKYGLLLIVWIYGLVVVIGGAAQYVLEKTSSAQTDKSLWTSLFTVAYTQANIGYGVATSTTLFSQVAIIASLFSGIFLQSFANATIQENSSLHLHEFRMCADILNAHYKRKHMLIIVKVIQSWWRLMKARMRKQPNSAVVALFYIDLAKFRTILVHIYRIQAGFFPNQVACFEEKVVSRIRRSNEYLYVVRHACAVVRYM